MSLVLLFGGRACGPLLPWQLTIKLIGPGDSWMLSGCYCAVRATHTAIKVSLMEQHAAACAAHTVLALMLWLDG